MPTPLLMTLTLLAADLLALAAAAMGAAGLRQLAGGEILASRYLAAAPLLAFIPAVFGLRGLYPGALLSPPDEFKRLCQGISLGFALLALLSFLAKQGHLYSRAVLLLAWAFSLALVPLARAGARRLADTRGVWGHPTVVINFADAETIADLLDQAPRLGLRIVAVWGAAPGLPPGAAGLSRLEDAPGPRPSEATALVVHPPARALDALPVDRFGRVLVLPDLPGVATLWTDARDLGGLLALDVRHKLLDPRRQRLKRLLDLALTAALLPLALPVTAAAALLVRLDSPGPVFFRHRRIGRGGREIGVWKFRTMRRDADEHLRACLARDPSLRAEWESRRKLRRDPRITRAGRWLRRTSLDELPQLWNVLRGDLSLVGPRPIVRDEISRYGGEGFALYQKVRPGLTGLWQVSGRSSTTYERRVALDSYYVRNWSVWLDLYILARTPAALVRFDAAC